MSTEDRRYDAFISYSRKDVVFARQLEAALEGYQPPIDLPVPQRRLNVFRDEADFTGTEYLAALRKHLAESSKLVVLCSPAARASKFVDEEIREAGKMIGAANIIPVLVAGGPNDAATTETEWAFPAELCEVLETPLAVDYRGFDSGRGRFKRGPFEGAWYGLLANLYGLGRDEIEQRERRRRRHEVRRAWTLGAAIALTVAAAVGAAVREKAIANEQSLSAESKRRLAASQAIADKALTNLDERPDLAALLAVEASQMAESVQAVRSLLTVLTRTPSTSLDKQLAAADDTVFGIAFSPDGKLLAAAGCDDRDEGLGTTCLRGSLVVLPLDGHGQPATLDERPGRVRAVAFSPTGKVLASGGESGTHLWDVATKKELNALPGDTANSLAFSPGGKLLAAGGRDGVSLWKNVTAGKPTPIDLSPHTRATILSVTFSPRGDILAAGGEDQQVTLWNVSTGKLQRELREPDIGAVTTVAFGQDGRTLIAGSEEAIVVWDLASDRKRSFSFKGHSRQVISVALSPDRRIMASGGLDNRVLLWDLETGQSLGPPLMMPSGVRATSFSPQGSTLAVGGHGGSLAIWDLDLASWRTRACRAANRNLTKAEWEDFIGGEPCRQTCPFLPDRCR